MTISATTNRASFTGNGVTTAFAFPYPFHAQADLIVISTVIATGVQTTKALTTHYTISGTTDAQGHYPDGGTVNFITAPASTESITIYRDPSLIQAVNLTENDDLPVESAVESPFDYLTMICQRLSDRLNRTLQQPEGDTANITKLPAKVTRASKYMAWDANGDPVATAGTTSTVVTTPYTLTLLDDANAAAARATLEFPTLGAEGSTLVITSGAMAWAATLLTGYCRLNYVSATQIKLSRYHGKTIPVKTASGWEVRAIASAGITAANTSVYVNGVVGQNLGASTTYLVCLFDNAGILTLDFLTVLTSTPDTDTGVEIATGLPTRTVIGLIHTNASNQFDDSAQLRHVLSWYNQRIIAGEGAFTASRTTASNTWTEINSEIRVSWLAWGDEAPFVIADGACQSSADQGTVLTALSIDSTTVPTTVHASTASGANGRMPVSPSYSALLSRGRHTATLLGATDTGTATWAAADDDTPGYTAKNHIFVLLRG